MLRNKKLRRKNNQRGSLVTILIFLMVLLLFWLSWGFIQQLINWEEDAPTEALQPVPLRISSPADFVRGSERLNKETLPNPEILDRFFPASFTLLIDGDDLNGDGKPNFLLVTEAERPASEALQELGYTYVITEAQLLTQQPDGSLSHLLSITPVAITGNSPDPLIAQVPATHGYGFSFSSHQEPPYDRPVMLFELTILDENLLPASDDLTIYWHPIRQTYAATNAFGAPGTF